MYTLLSCSCRHRFAQRTSHLHHLTLIHKPSSSFLRLHQDNLLILKRSNNISFKTMSSTSKKSAFDILMSNASKKKPQPSPKKRKPQEFSNAQIQNPSVSQTNVETTLNGNSLKNLELRGDSLDKIKMEDTQIETSPKKLKTLELKKEIQNPSDSNKFLENTLDGSSLKNVELSGNSLDLIKIEGAQIENGAKDRGKKGKLSPDESVSELKKKAGSFDPKKAAYWGDGERVPFMFVVKGLDAISQVSGRIVITEILCNMLRTVIETTPGDLVSFVYLLGNRIAPAHEGLELGLGDASIIKALAEACGAKEAHIKKQYKELGDLGLVAKASRSSQPLMRKPEPLTVAKVLDTFHIIAKESGKDSQEKKKNHIKSLLVAATDCEPLYLIRLLQTKLRIGLAEQTLLTALGHAAFYSGKQFSPHKHVESPLEEAAKIVKQVYSVIPVYDKIIPALLADGVWDLPKTCSFSPGVPIGPMLAKPTKGVSEILDKFQNMEFTCEYKYDGERAQIHYLDNGSVEIYSRNAERNTGKFPDVVAAVGRLRNPSVTSFVLDCEVVAFDREKQRILPFQVLSTRARKNVVMSEIRVEVCIYAFDLLYLNGQSLLQDQLNIRREKLYKSFEEEPGVFQFATAISSNDLEEIQSFLETAVNSSCEGLIIKTLTSDATYEPSKRSNNWLKLKKDYMDSSVGDSFDLVPIAAFHGRGKRTGVYGAFLLACYDNSKEEFQSICKIGTGFSEAVLEERSTSLRSKVISKPKSYFRYSETLNPDVWFDPTEVWEVKAADLTISPVHRAAVGIVDPDKGISLRFPRLLRIREDKGPEQATSSDMVAEMYYAQKNNHRDEGDNED